MSTPYEEVFSSWIATTHCDVIAHQHEELMRKKDDIVSCLYFIRDRRFRSALLGAVSVVEDKLKEVVGEALDVARIDHQWRVTCSCVCDKAGKPVDKK